MSLLACSAAAFSASRRAFSASFFFSSAFLLVLAWASSWAICRRALPPFFYIAVSDCKCRSGLGARFDLHFSYQTSSQISLMSSNIVYRQNTPYPPPTPSSSWADLLLSLAASRRRPFPWAGLFFSIGL